MSRFVREIDEKYLDHPLPKEGRPQTGSVGFGSRFSDGVERQRPFAFTPREGRPSPQDHFPPRDKTAVKSPVQSKPELIDPNFVPSPISELKVGQRVEHNRFGGGLITEITNLRKEQESF